MKKTTYVVCAIIGTCVTVLFVMATMLFHTYTYKNCQLLINDEVIQNDIVVHGKSFTKTYNFPYFSFEPQQSAEIPFLVVFQHLGGQIEWIDKENAKLVFDGAEYDFHLIDEPSLISRETEEELLEFIILGPNSNYPHFYGIRDNDAYYGPRYMEGIFEHLGIDIEIVVNNKSKTVSIQKTGDGSPS